MNIRDRIGEFIQTKFFGGMGTGFFVSNLLSGGAFGRTEFMKKYQGYVYPCISAIAEEVATIEFFMEKQLKDGTERVDTHEVINLLNNPNPDWTKFQLIEMSETHLELVGEFFWYLKLKEVSRKPVEIWPLRPDLMDVAKDKESGRVIGYTLFTTAGGKVPLERDEVLHCKMPNPLNPYRGMGSIEAGIHYIETDEITAKFSKNFLRNNATPAGILNFKGTISQEDFEEVKKKWKKEYEGEEKAGKVGFLKSGQAEFTKVGLGLNEIAMKELKNLTRDDIMTMFRVSKPILGIVEDVNRANAKETKRIFLENVVEPKMRRIVDALNKFLVPRYRDDLKLNFESPVPEDMIEKAEYYEKALNKWLSYNDIRREQGDDPIEGGEDIYQPLNLIPVGAPKPETQKSEDDEKVTIKTIKKKVKKNKLEFNDTQKETYRQGLYKKQRAWERKFVQNIGKGIDDLEKETLERMRPKKAVTKDIEGWIPKLEEIKSKIGEATMFIIYELFKDQGDYAFELIGFDGEFIIQPGIKKLISDRVGKFSTKISQNMRGELAESLADGLQKGESITKLTKRVEEIYQGWKGYPAERIARSETTYASNKATIEAWKQSGYVNRKEWYVNPGACEFCRPMQGKVIGLDDDFWKVGEDIAGDKGGTHHIDFENIGHPPLHPNCECTILPAKVGE